MARVPKRNSTVPAPQWWIDAADYSKKMRGLINAQITERVRELLGLESLDESRVSRCLTGDTTPVPLLQAISRTLGIPSPVLLPVTMAEARLMASVAAELAGAMEPVGGNKGMVDAAIDEEIDAMGVELREHFARRQTQKLRSIDAGQGTKRSRGRVGGGRRRAGEG